MITNRAIDKLRERFGDSIREVSEFRGQTLALVDCKRIRDICAFLRDDDELLFDMAIDVVGADRLILGDETSMKGYVNDPFDRQIRSKIEQVPPNERFEVIYILYSNRHKEYFSLKVRVAESGDMVPSVTQVWASVNWAEREVFDMFGILFEGHPDLRRVYMPEDFAHYPLRKDFPLMGIPGSLPLPDKQ